MCLPRWNTSVFSGREIWIDFSHNWNSDCFPEDRKICKSQQPQKVIESLCDQYVCPSNYWTIRWSSGFWTLGVDAHGVFAEVIPCSSPFVQVQSQYEDVCVRCKNDDDRWLQIGLTLGAGVTAALRRHPIRWKAMHVLLNMGKSSWRNLRICIM